jgi:hypothetical protein
MKILVYFQLALTVFGFALLSLLVTPVAGVSFAGGAAVTLFNFVVLVFAWPRILAQKQVALALFTIIFKFAILGLILYLVARSPSLQAGWFAFGLATVFPSILVAALQLQADEKADHRAVQSDLGARS